MIVRSFRLRLALFQALLAGITLVAFAAGAWWLIRDANVLQIDTLLRAEVEREVQRQRDVDAWDAYADTLNRTFSMQHPSNTLLLVMESGGSVRYRSAHWPATLDAARFSWPLARMGSEIQGGPAPTRPSPAMMPGAAVPGATDGDTPPITPRAAIPAIAVTAVTVGGEPWRMGLAALPHAQLAVGVSLSGVEREMLAVRNAFLVAIPLTLLAIAMAIWIFSTRAIRPVRHLTRTIQNVTAQGLNQRIESAAEDREFSELISVFNDMLDRLERGFMQASRFSADAAHELKTPLAILQGQVERAITQAPAGSPLQGSLTGILDEIRRLSSISQKLLLLSQADAGHMRLALAPLDLSAELDDLVDDVQLLAPGLRVESRIASGITIKADAALLKQVLHNLVSNAIKYNIEGGWIRITAVTRDAAAEIEVANASLGIAEDERGKLFERFYRADPARSRNIDGVGLGLSVSREIARAHGGDLMLADAAAGETRFALRLPLLASG
jgi:heavy metal sensor kinase